MLTPNGCESSEDGCETLRSARNAKTRMLSFSGSIKHLTGSDFPTKRTNETNQRENAHPNSCEKKCQLFKNRPFCD
jgi:hypothetical protein